MTLTLKTAIQTLCMLLQPFVLSSKVLSQKVKWFEIWNKLLFSEELNPNCNLNLNGSNLIFLRDTLTHHNTPPYKVWMQTGLTVQMISSGEKTWTQSDEQLIATLTQWLGVGGYETAYQAGPWGIIGRQTEVCF